MSPIWKFKPLAKDDKRVDPIQREFFTTESVGELPEALIREAIQNSLDAKLPGHEGPVQVRIYLSESTGRTKGHLPFFHGLEPHLAAHGNGLDNPPPLDHALAFITIEDFGTKGLPGNPEEYNVGDENSPGEHNFYYFWRNVGRSEKGEKDRGRWGLGKTVFPASSRYNSFFGLTIPYRSSTGLLMGESVLKIHMLGPDEYYHPYGGYGTFRDAENERYFALPVTDGKTLKTFCEVFCLKRREESGLSIVIPAPIEDVKFSGLLAAVLRQYFYPIIAGDLVVSLESPGISLEVNSENISEALAYYPEKERSSLGKLFEFTRWSLERKSEDDFELESSNPMGAPIWANFLDNVDQAQVQDKFEKEGRFSFRVKLRVQLERGREIRWSNFCVYFERDSELKKGQGTFIREGITIAGIQAGIEGNIRGLAIFTDGPLASLLGDAENPAHTEWHSSSPKFKGKYKHGPSTLNFVKKSLRELALFLTRPREGVDKDLLKEFFFLERPVDEPVGSVTLRPDDDSSPEETPPTPPIPDSRRELIRIERLQGGVRVDLAPDETIDLPLPITLEFAYGVRRGNPFRKYHRLDFDVSRAPLTVNFRSASLSEAAENRIEGSILDRDFEITVTGFDPSRDLIVRAAYDNA